MHTIKTTIANSNGERAKQKNYQIPSQPVTPSKQPQVPPPPPPPQTPPPQPPANPEK